MSKSLILSTALLLVFLWNVNLSAASEVSADSFFTALSGELKDIAKKGIDDHKKFTDSFKENYLSSGDLNKEFIYQEWTGGNWNNLSRELSLVDTTGENWIWTSEEFIFDQGAWANYQRYVVVTTPLIGEDQKILGSDSYLWVDNAWTHISTISYTYTENLLTEVIIKIAVEENVFMPFQKYTFTYNEMELVESETISNYETEWIDDSRTTYVYNEQGKPKEINEAYWRNNAWENSSRINITYGIYDLPSEKIEYKYNLGNEIPFVKTNYEYSNAVPEQLLSENEYHWLQNNWQYVIKKTYQYNSAQLLTGITTEENNSGNFLFTARTTYDYNASNLETERLYQVYDGSNWVNKNRMLTIYTITSVEEENSPQAFMLYDNYPNPFNPETIISYTLAQDSRIVLRVFNAVGEEVSMLVNEEQTAGLHKIKFSASDLPSGIYLYRIEAGSNVETRKMVLTK